MLSSVLSSERAILVNIAIIRTFVRLPQILTTHEELARQMEELRWRQSEQGQKIEAVFETIQQLIEAPAEEPKRRIGFPTSEAGPALSEVMASSALVVSPKRRVPWPTHSRQRFLLCLVCGSEELCSSGLCRRCYDAAYHSETHFGGL